MPADVTWEGVVDPFFASSSMKEEIERVGIPVYASGEDFYRERGAELAVICTPPFCNVNKVFWRFETARRVKGFTPN